jgi:hypothetical protein
MAPGRRGHVTIIDNEAATRGRGFGAAAMRAFQASSRLHRTATAAAKTGATKEEKKQEILTRQVFVCESVCGLKLRVVLFSFVCVVGFFDLKTENKTMTHAERHATLSLGEGGGHWGRACSLSPHPPQHLPGDPHLSPPASSLPPRTQQLLDSAASYLPSFLFFLPVVLPPALPHSVFSSPSFFLDSSCLALTAFSSPVLRPFSNSCV